MEINFFYLSDIHHAMSVLANDVKFFKLEYADMGETFKVSYRGLLGLINEIQDSYKEARNMDVNELKIKKIIADIKKNQKYVEKNVGFYHKDIFDKINAEFENFLSMYSLR